MPMRVVVGVDSSTQSTKVVRCDAATGRVLDIGRARHPEGTEVAPAAWGDALDTATGDLLDDAVGVAVGGQQHGMVVLDPDGRVVRDALLWNDTRSAGAAADLIDELGGPAAWADAVGVVPVASLTVTKLRWLAEHEPDLARRVDTVVLPHDWLTSVLCARSQDHTTDRGDASGTGYWSPATGAYRPDLLRMAFGRDLAVPRVAAPAELVGTTPTGVAVAAGTGDNMAAALGLGLGPGDVAVSLGTSGTVFAVADQPVVDASGTVAGFADATGRHLPIVVTLNAARVLDATAALLGVDLRGLSDLALTAPSGAGGLVLLPYLDGERTPDLPDATGTLAGLTRAVMTPAHLARAAVEGMLCGLADGLDALRAVGVVVDRLLLIGGAARSPAVQAIAPAVLGVDVVVPAPGEYAAVGAARQAAWAVAGSTDPPDWPVPVAAVLRVDDPDAGTVLRARYAEARGTMHPETRPGLRRSRR